ncbi:MAG TPA: hypothetical protein VE686_08985, partial [Beijerinckiaceae bacterium]|nr:hypothetical protein [Beijerinckiaceae bacterium]
ELPARVDDRFAADEEPLPLDDARERVLGADPFPDEPARFDALLARLEDFGRCDDFCVFWAILTSL